MNKCIRKSGSEVWRNSIALHIVHIHPLSNEYMIEYTWSSKGMSGVCTAVASFTEAEVFGL